MANVPLKSLKFPGLGNKYTVDSLTTDVKSAILQIASKVAYIDEHGQDYYDDLYNALYPPASTFTVTNALTNCTTSNAAVAATEGDPYSAIITADEMYSLVGATVSVTMGGTDITSIAYSNGAIDISTVTGAIVITIAAVAVSLESISAVYTQSGTVYDTDSLDSLKSDLTVTANYVDGTSETVTLYTLSGTLTAGTSTITVGYAGKNTTFNVAVSTDYVTVSYIEATGTQYINIGFIPDQDTKIVFDYMNLKAIGDSFQVPIGAVSDTGTTASDKVFYFYIGGQNTLAAGVCDNVQQLILSSPVIANGDRDVYALSVADFSVDGTSYGVPHNQSQGDSPLRSSVGFPFYVFARNHGNTIVRANAHGRVYELSIYSSNELVKHYVPSYSNLSNEYGLFETISHVFYGNAGTGAITGA